MDTSCVHRMLNDARIGLPSSKRHQFDYSRKRSLELHALRVGEIVTNEIMDAAGRKAEALGGFKELLNHYRPLYQQAEKDVLHALEGGPLPQGVTLEALEKKRKLLADKLAEITKKQSDDIAKIAYIDKDQYNKTFGILTAKKMISQQLRQQILVATTKFLMADLENITQSLGHIMTLLFDDVLQNRREKD
jgi:hypothetical protein